MENTNGKLSVRMQRRSRCKMKQTDTTRGIILSLYGRTREKSKQHRYLRPRFIGYRSNSNLRTSGEQGEDDAFREIIALYPG